VPTLQQDESTIDLTRVRATLALSERLSATPPWAQVRGFLFKMTADGVDRHGRAAAAMHRRVSPTPSRWFFRMYSAREYLADLAAAAAVIAPADPISALRGLWGTIPGYARLFNASRFMGLLGADVMGVVRWLEPHRHFFANYGRWRMEPMGERYFVMHYFDECIWIEGAHRGGMEGLLAACGVQGTVEPDLDTPLSGRLHVRWHPR
jgi:uncharacterized protein (TIGR02265 family)